MEQAKNKICQRKQLQLDPREWCTRLGQPCSLCNALVTHEKSISLCGCYYFCHQNCFISAFASQITDELTDIRCDQCKQVVNATLEANYAYSPSCSTLKVGKATLVLVLLFLNVLALGLTFNSKLDDGLKCFLIYVQVLAQSLLLYFMAVCARDILYAKSVAIKEIRSSKLDILTSAFNELDIYSNQQLTKDYLAVESKQQSQI